MQILNLLVYVCLTSCVNYATAKSEIASSEETSIQPYEHWSNPIRRLIGSNCIVIEQGAIPKYYDCTGCRIEEASACVEDMRLNKSKNVYPTCDMSSMMQSPDTSCCPRVDSQGHLIYMGSAYPYAIHCMEYVNCQKFVIYAQLKQECESICPPAEYKDAKGIPLCEATFNSANKVLNLSPWITILSGLALVISFLC